ncbi:MAG: hypothetical protein K6F86_09415 [Lachnospiraceae bacterium]|nr:hypothetical protein [Lachnospiraceae bacterium]
MLNRLNDDDLEKVNGGAGKTPGGYPIDNKGNVHFTGKDGVTVVINAADWKWLLGNFGPTNPEAYLAVTPGHDVSVAIDEHHRGAR